MEEELKKIAAYIEFLKKDRGLMVTVHDGGKGFIGDVLLSYLPYNVHSNGYCLYVKRSREVWDRCIFDQKKVCRKVEKDGAVYGMCFMGVEEFVFPITSSDELIGFVSVSGYGTDRKKAEKRIADACSLYGFDKSELLSVYEKELRHEKPSFESVRTLIEPLCMMLSYVYTLFGEQLCKGGPGGDNYVYGHIITYINKNFQNNITLSELTELCHCSKSHISHLFKAKSGCGLCEYINDKRCEYAARMLCSSDMRIGEIAFSAGFDDSNYFSNVFRKYAGISPREYRSRFQNRK